MSKQFSRGPFSHHGEQRPHTLLESAAHGGVDPSLEAQGPKYCEPGAEDPALQSREEGFLQWQFRSLGPQQFCLLPPHPGLSQTRGKGDPFFRAMMFLGSGPDWLHFCLPRFHQTLPPASASSWNWLPRNCYNLLPGSWGTSQKTD